MNRRSTAWNRRWASCGASSETGGCGPMTSSSSGMRSVISRPLAPRASPSASRQALEFGLALAQKLTDEPLKRLRQRRVRDVTLVLVELAGREETVRRDQRLVQLVHHRGLADAGVSRNEYEFRRTRGDDLLERVEQSGHLARASVELFGDQHPVERIVLAERKRVDAATGFPRGAAPLKIALDTGGGLVAVLGILSEQFHDQLGDRLGDGSRRSRGATGVLAIWQWTHSMGSDAVNGSVPVSIS